MAGKSLMPYIGSSSNNTYNIEGEPTLANQLIRVEEYTMEGVNAVWAQPLAAMPGSPAILEPIGELPGSAEPTPLGPVQPPVRQRDPSPLAMLRRPKFGGIRLPIELGLLKARSLFQDDEKAAPPPAERYVGTLFTKANDEVLHKYVTPTATPSTPKEDRFHIQGVRTPGGGYGKGLLWPLTASEKEGAAESRSPPPMKVKRHLTPPPIVRAAGQCQEDEVKSSEPSIHKLAVQVKKLRKENIELRDRNAELGVELAEIRNNFDTLSRGLCAKIKRAFIEMGKENKYYAN
ncbi:hypothetical protein OsI_07027 [Oryza sativa Indica Group]|uniref:Uncharacterized protein n=1 Tax=Oryza sativa subsp. indica TaxID=39946 RepID=A2X497_ORYSI|nr:hypothetical protein OsI_07027 [Oryza sativa Indica Group]